MKRDTETAARLIERAKLSGDELADMYRLLDSHFEGVTREQFRLDLEAKNWVVLIERGQRLVGFSTMLAYETLALGEPLSVIYSGDTIVAPEAWNTATLPRGWIESVALLRRHYPRGRYLWMLITSGFRTYRFLPVFWREFFPRHDGPTPPYLQRLLDELASERFGPAYDPSAGIVRFQKPQKLRSELAAIPAGRCDDPHIAYFAARNPGHAQGDELVCLTELAPANLTPAGKRMAAAVPQW